MLSESGGLARLFFFVYVLEIIGLTLLSLMPIASIPAAIPLVTAKNVPSGWALIIDSWDKGQHLVEYVLLYITGSLAYQESRKVLVRHLLLYSVLIELAQEFLTENRHAQWGDIVADGIGMGLGQMLIYTPLMLTLSKRKNRHS